MQKKQAVKSSYQTLITSPLGQIQLISRAGRLAALDFVDETTAASHSENSLKPSEGLLDGRRISGFRLAGEGEFALPMPLASINSTDCVLLKEATLSELPQAEAQLVRQVTDQLNAYFQGKSKTFSIPLLLDGTEFQRRIWQTLLEIPFGTSLSYGELAEKAGYSASGYGRAAGTAVGSNPISVLVPCHRIVGRDGKLTGYSGGLWRKLHLLALEGFRVAI